jgi:hypothetical protein
MKRSGIVRHSTMILPYGMKTLLGYKYKKCMYFSYLTRKLGARFKLQDPVPIAPSELMETGRAEGPQETGMLLGLGLSRGLDRAHDRGEQYGAHVEAMKAVSNSAARGLQRGFRASLLHLARGRSRTGYVGLPEVGRRCLTGGALVAISRMKVRFMRDAAALVSLSKVRLNILKDLALDKMATLGQGEL